jgi:hypothetical protein
VPIVAAPAHTSMDHWCSYTVYDRKTFLTVTLSIQKGLNSGLLCKMPATNHLICGTAQYISPLLLRSLLISKTLKIKISGIIISVLYL